MGRQVRFIMDEEDERTFLDFVKTTGDVIVLPSSSPQAEYSALTELPGFSSEQFDFFLWLFNRSVSSRLVTEYVPQQGYFVIDRQESSVVEFSRTIIDQGVIRSGRLWAEFKYLDSEGNWAFTEPEFKKWYEVLAKWIRKHYTREIDLDLYVSPGALGLVKKGKLKVEY